jgi:hypothetical protein
MVVEGLHVFPCRSDKRPACPHGFYDAVPHDRSAELFRKYPGPLVAAPTGATNDFDVLDVDVGGENFVMMFECTHGALPLTRVIGTPSGGQHYYFRHRPGLRLSAGRLAKNIDVRTTGGYAIVKGAGYRTLVDAEIAPWPAAMIQLLEEATERGQQDLAPKSSGLGVTAGWHELLPRPLWFKIIEVMSTELNRRRVRGILRPVVEARENRNQSCYWAALQFRELINANIISRTDVEELLFMCMELNGYVEEKVNGAWRASRTIRSGLNARRYG